MSKLRQLIKELLAENTIGQIYIPILLYFIIIILSINVKKKTYNRPSLIKTASWNADFVSGNNADHIWMISEYSSLVHLISNSDRPKIKVIPDNESAKVCDKDFS